MLLISMAAAVQPDMVADHLDTLLQVHASLCFVNWFWISSPSWAKKARVRVVRFSCKYYCTFPEVFS